MESRIGQWRKKFKQKLQEKLETLTIHGFIKSQRIQRLRHVTRRSTDVAIRLMLYWKDVRKKKATGSSPWEKVNWCCRKRFGNLESSKLKKNSARSKQIELSGAGIENSFKAGKR